MRDYQILVGLVAIFMSACSDNSSGATAGEVKASVERGRYIVENVAGCGDCHNPIGADGRPDPGQFLAGRECFIDVDPADDTFGCLPAPNLTGDATGLLNRTDTEIKAMFLDGVRPDGTFLVSVMPYYQYHNMTDNDADSIVMFLRTVTGIENRVASRQAPWDDVPAAATPIDLTQVPSPAADYAELESATRGRYIASVLGNCLECHTPENEPGSAEPRDLSRAFAGGNSFRAAAFGLPVPPFPEVIYTSNLTSDETGLAGWTAEQIITVLHQGRDRDDKGICPPMPVGPMGAFGGMTDRDALDVANYLLSLPAFENQIPNDCATPE